MLRPCKYSWINSDELFFFCKLLSMRASNLGKLCRALFLSRITNPRLSVLLSGQYSGLWFTFFLVHIKKIQWILMLFIPDWFALELVRKLRGGNWMMGKREIEMGDKDSETSDSWRMQIPWNRNTLNKSNSTWREVVALLNRDPIHLIKYWAWME